MHNTYNYRNCDSFLQSIVSHEVFPPHLFFMTVSCLLQMEFKMCFCREDSVILLKYTFGVNDKKDWLICNVEMMGLSVIF